MTGANATLYLAGAPLLAGWLGLPIGVLLAVGALLTVYAALVCRLATRPAMPRAAVVAVIAANALWVADSLLALGLDWFSPTPAGQILIAVQAFLVAGWPRSVHQTRPLSMRELGAAQLARARRAPRTAPRRCRGPAGAAPARAVDALELEAQHLVGRQRPRRADAHAARPDIDGPALDRRSGEAVERALLIDLDPR